MVPNKFKNRLNSNRCKKDLSCIKKIEIKYGCEGSEEGKIFLHRNFSIFEMDFKLKFREISRCRIK
jgi:hypothetical protein